MGFEFKVDDNLVSDFMTGFTVAATAAIVETMATTAMDSLREAFNWGDDHEMEQETSNDGTTIVDNVTVTAPNIRNNPQRNATFANTTVPNFFSSINSRLVVDFASNLSNSIGAFVGKFL